MSPKGKRRESTSGAPVIHVTSFVTSVTRKWWPMCLGSHSVITTSLPGNRRLAPPPYTGCVGSSRNPQDCTEC